MTLQISKWYNCHQTCYPVENQQVSTVLLNLYSICVGSHFKTTFWHDFVLEALEQRFSLIYVQVCSSWFAFTFACLPWKKQREQTRQAVIRKVFFSWTVLFDTTEGSLWHQHEVRNERVHEVVVASCWCWQTPGAFSFRRWAGWLFRSEVVSVVKPLSDVWEKREGHREATEIFSVFVQGDKCTPLFSYSLRELWSWSSALARCPLSLPSLLHSPYLLPLFMRQPSCSALMRGHLTLLGWREGDGALR